MGTPEFIDTYSDDLIYLTESRKAILTHPLMQPWDDNVTASFARMYCILMVGAFEAMVSQWKAEGRDALGILTAFDEKDASGKRLSNRERVARFQKALCQANVEPDVQVLDDYLAIKYMRNTIVHAAWKKSERQWIQQRGFPDDSRKLSEKHLQRFVEVCQAMTEYVAWAGFLKTRLPNTFKTHTESLSVAIGQNDVIGCAQFRELHWNNLERISTHIGNAIYNVLVDHPSRLPAEGEAAALTRTEIKMQYYGAAERTAKSRPSSFDDVRSLANTAIFSWNEYRTSSNAVWPVDDGDLSTASSVLADLHRRRRYPSGAFPEFPLALPEEAQLALVKAAFGEGELAGDRDICKMHHTGATCYRRIRNITPILLFGVQLPIIDEERSQEYYQIAAQCLAQFWVGRSWYSLIELRREPDEQWRQFYTKWLAQHTGACGLT